MAPGWPTLLWVEARKVLSVHSSPFGPRAISASGAAGGFSTVACFWSGATTWHGAQNFSAVSRPARASPPPVASPAAAPDAAKTNAAKTNAAKSAFDRARARRAPRQSVARARAAVERAQARRARDEAAVVRLEKTLAELQADLAAAEIVSPIAGTVTARKAAPGQKVAPGDEEALFLVAPEDALRVEATLDAAQAARVSVGDRARVTLEDGQERVGAVREIRDLADRRKTIVVGVETPGLPARTGAAATISIGEAARAE